MPNRDRYGGKQRGGHRRHHSRQSSYDSESDYSGSYSDESSDGGSAAAGPLSMLADGLLGMVAAKKPTEQDVEDRSTATSQGDHRYHKHKERQPRGLSRPRRRDDGSVLSGISEATKIRSGVMTKEPIAVCSTTAYGSDFLTMSEAVPPKKRGYFLRSGPKSSQSASKGKKANGMKTGPQSNDKSDVSIVTESPMPINVSSGFASKQWARKFDEKDAINKGPQRVQVGKNGAVTYTSTRRVAGGKRHYYVGMKSTKNPLGKKPDPHYIGRHSMLSDTMASEVTSHRLNSLPRQHSQSQKGTGNTTAYDGETIETIPTKELRGKSFSTLGHHQDGGLHRYGNYSLPDPDEKGSHGTSVTDDMESVASSLCSRSVRIKTKRRRAETNEVELEMLLEEESLSGSSSGSEDDSEFSVSVVHEEGDDDEEEVDGLPGEVDVSVGDGGSTSTTSTSSTSSSASSQITSARSEPSSVEHEKENNVAPPVGDKCVNAPVASVNVRGDNGSDCSDDSSDTSPSDGQDINESDPPLPQVTQSDVHQYKGGADKYHAPKPSSGSLSTSSTTSPSQDESHAKREKTRDRRDPSTRPPLPPSNRRKSNASQPSPRPSSTPLNKNKNKKKEKELKKMKRVELEVLGPVNSPMQQDTNFVQDKVQSEKKSGFVKETVENMLEAAFSPDGENLRSYDQNNQKGRTFRPKIPFFDSMTSSDESEQSSVKDWADVESWCSSVQENSTKDVSRWQRRVKYPNKKNKKGWYAKPVEEIKNKQGYEVDVVQLGLKKGGKGKNKGKGKAKGKAKT